MDVAYIKLPSRYREMFNALYLDKDPKVLTDDLYAVELPDGCSISVGWYPEHDPSGEYEILFHSCLSGLEDFRIAHTKSLDEVVSIIESWCSR